MFLRFRFYLPLEIGVALHLNKLESSGPIDALKKIFRRCQFYFYNYPIISLRNKPPLYLGMLCVKFDCWLKKVQWFWRRSQTGEKLKHCRKPRICTSKFMHFTDWGYTTWTCSINGKRKSYINDVINDIYVGKKWIHSIVTPNFLI